MSSWDSAYKLNRIKAHFGEKEGLTTALKLPSSHCFQVRSIDPGQACVTALRVFAIGTYFGYIPSLGRTSYCCIQQVLAGIIPTTPPLASIPNAYHSHFLICQLPSWCVYY
jgi:hypothetical protein